MPQRKKLIASLIQQFINRVDQDWDSKYTLYGKGISSIENFSGLSKAIETEIKKFVESEDGQKSYVSHSTISRILKHPFSVDLKDGTADILSQYLGYESFTSFSAQDSILEETFQYEQSSPKAFTQAVPQSLIAKSKLKYVLATILIMLAIFLSIKHLFKIKPQDYAENLAFIKGGSFEMGDVFGEGKENERPTRTILINDFYIGKYEVTFTEYDRYLDAENMSTNRPYDYDWGRGNRPVINVDWYDAIEYCNWLSKQNSLVSYYTIDRHTVDSNNFSTTDNKKWTIHRNESANGFRLPTEAEWEYAARQRGQKVRFGNGKNIADPREMNFDSTPERWYPHSRTGKYIGKTLPVDSFEPNEQQMYNTSGNVWEWCDDWFSDSTYITEKEHNNPKGPSSGLFKVLRGGSFQDGPTLSRTTARFRDNPDAEYFLRGFRVARNK